MNRLTEVVAADVIIPSVASDSAEAVTSEQQAAVIETPSSIPFLDIPDQQTFT